jgi:hypothetical protein
MLKTTYLFMYDIKFDENLKMTRKNADRNRSLHFGKYPPGRRNYQPKSFGGKNMKRGREKGDNIK